MATSNILGLFTSPEQYQAQQLAQQQANEQQRAINFASLDPRGQANYGTFLGAQQLGRGFAGLLGVQDPQLQRIRQRQEIMQTINPADPESLMAGIQRASQTGDQELALTLTEFMNKQGSEMALAAQRKAQANKERFQSQSAGAQEAELIGTFTEQLQKTTDPKEREVIQAKIKRLEKNLTKADELEDLFAAEVDAVAQATARAQATDKATPSQTVGLYGSNTAMPAAVNVDDDPRVKGIRARIKTLTATTSGRRFESIVRAERIGTLTNELAALNAAGKKDTNEYRNKAAILESLKSGGGSKEVKEIVIADQIVALDKIVREAKDPNAPEVLDAKAKVAVLRSQLKSDKPNLTVVGEVKSGADKGKAVYVDETNDQQFVYDFKDGKQVRKPFVGDVDRVTSQNIATASTSNIGEKTVVKGVAELDVEDLKTVRGNKRAASASNDSLRKLLDLTDKGLIEGAFATGRLGVGSLLNTLGIMSKKDADNLSNSEQYQKIGADLVFNALQGKLGPGVSEGDRKFITELFPKLETSGAARRQLIKYLADKNNKQIDEANAAEDWLRKYKSFEGYKPLNSGVFNVPTTRLDLTGMSKGELEAAIEKAKKKKKGK